MVIGISNIRITIIEIKLVINPRPSKWQIINMATANATVNAYEIYIAP